MCCRQSACDFIGFHCGCPLSCKMKLLIRAIS
ncbi:Uncharacterized protein HZ326_25315, partial [Fusarium oxysporum f. sp. albedinis]